MKIAHLLDEYNQADLEELRREALNLVCLAVLIVLIGVLWLAVIDDGVRQPILLLILLLLVASAGVSQLHRGGMVIITSLLMCMLSLVIVVASASYHQWNLLYFFSLLVIVATLLLEEMAGIIVAILTSVFVLILAQSMENASISGLTDYVIAHIWLTVILSWLAIRPTEMALRWSWRSYLLADRRTQELQDRQYELNRLTKGLQETIDRLEWTNAELDRERRAAEEARRLKAEFAAAISHELRTPLNLILGFSEMMIRAPDIYSGHDLPPAYRRDLEIIYENASHISRLIDDVLDLSQIEADRMALERTYTSLHQVVHEAVATMTLLYEHLGLTLTVDVPTDLPMLYIDANRVRQILINLLNNAARFTHHGGATVRATLDGRYVVIVVSDTGAGIAPEDLPYVFQEFRQVGPAGRHRGGNGLGLALCKRFAELHGGYMWVESHLGAGSSFYFALPIGENVITSPTQLNSLSRSTLQLTVVVLDPTDKIAKIFQRYMDGYQVIRVSSLVEVKNFMNACPIHALILTDPEIISDHQILTDQRLRRIPIFTCELQNQCAYIRDSRIVEHLVKPVSQDHLLKALHRISRKIRDILIVEDDAEMARLLTDFLRTGSRHYRVQWARNGAEARVQFVEKSPDLVLLDLLLPDINGYELLRLIRRAADSCSVPIIIISGQDPYGEIIRFNRVKLNVANGLTVSETLRCLRGSLDALLNRGQIDNARAQQ